MDAKVNYQILLISTSILSFALGIFMPFWIIFIQGFGGSIETFAFAIGLMAVVQAIASYFVGKYSDKLGRKIFILISGFVITLVILAYTFINSLWQLYVLQVIYGLAQAAQMTMEASMLGDYTKKVSRGYDIGKYHAITGVIAGVAMIGGGYIAGQFGIKIIFYITAVFFLVSTMILFSIKEE